MGLQLEVTSEHKEILGDDHVRLFGEDGGTIGRSLHNDWILPDADRFISGKHATIDYQAGAYYLADTSTNGVYINGEDEPIGKGNPRRLFDGDRIRMGDFEFLVRLDEGEGLEMPPPEPMTVVPDHIEQLVPEDEPRSGIQLLDEEELTGNEEFQDLLFGSSVQPKLDESKKPRFDNQDNPFEKKPEPPPLGPGNVLDAFLGGLGVSRAEIHATTDPLEVMENAGKVLKEFIEGTAGLLASRAALKAMFRLDQTTVLPRHNNPLKLSESSRESIMQLLVGKEGEYLAPVDAVKEVCRDLKFHQDATLEAMISAFMEFSDRFDPDELRENFDRILNRKPLFDALNKLKYWQLYCDLYPTITQPGSGPFPYHFGEEFVRAYEKHIAEYKRMERDGDSQRVRRELPDVPVQQPPDGELVDQTEEAQFSNDLV